MGRKSKLYFNEALSQYVSTIQGKKYYFGTDEKTAVVKFEQLLAGGSPEPEISGKSKGKAITLQNLIARFLKFKRETTKSSTADWYEYYLKPVAERIGATTRIDRITLATLIETSEKLSAEHDYALNSHRGLVRSIKSVFAYAEESKLLDHNPAKSRKLSVGSYSKSERISVPTDEQCKEVIKFCDKRNPALSELIKFLYFSGARFAEARQIKVQDINLAKRTILMPVGETKGYKQHGKRRTIYLGDNALAIVQKNLTDKSKTDYLFQNPNALSQGQQWLTSTIKDFFHRTNKDLGFHFNLRGIRHVAITNMLLANIDILSVAKLVGHANLNMIQRIYEELRTEHLIEQASKI